MTFVWLEEETGQKEGWKCAAMEYGGLSVTDMGTGTPWMPLWCADSFATSMKVRTVNGQTLYVLQVLAFLLLTPHHLVYSLVLFFLIIAYSTCTTSTNKLGKGVLGKRGYYFTL